MGDTTENRKLRGRRYVALVRSSDAGEGTTSTEAQLSLLKDHAEKNGMICAGEIVLDGISGSMPGKRSDLQEIFRRKVEQDDFDVLVVQRVDRLTRGGSDHGFWIEHECKRVGIQLIVVGDDIPEERYASLIKVAKYEAAREQAFSISQRSTQGYQLALDQGRVVTSSHTPYGCWRLYLSTDETPLFIIRDLRDGRQQKLDAKTHSVIDTYGQSGGGSKGHYRKQKQEKVLLMPGDADQVGIVREIFELHFRQGWGGKRIADHLNRRGIPSPKGRAWGQRQVEVIYYQEVYTGKSIGNRTSTAIYHRRSKDAPQRVDLNEEAHATARTMPVQLRPLEEWVVQPQPLMEPFLGDEKLRQLAIDGQQDYWQHLADAGRTKRSTSKHKASEYLLTGLLFAQQDGEALVGVLCGRVVHKVRYYRHRRGRRGYIKGAVFNRLIHAETIEAAVFKAVRESLNANDLRKQVLALIRQSSQTIDHGKLNELQKQREQLKRRTQLIVSSLDEDTLADAQSELDRLKVRRRELDDQITVLESANSMVASIPTPSPMRSWRGWPACRMA